ncbi:MAG: permease-like cell division protein FtsX [Acutalibacteraceae bacterium]
MRISSIKYLTGEGFKNVWVHRLMSLASIGVLLACMIMMGVAVILSLNVEKALGTIEDQNAIVAFFSDDISDENAKSITEQTIAGIDNIKSCEFVSREEGLDRQKETMGDDYAALFDYISDENPLPNAAQIIIEDLNYYDETIDAIKAVEGVDHVNEQREISTKLNSISNTINSAGFWIVGLLFVISIAIVSNTIKITMFSRKLEINIMKAVGATDAFIRFPFVIEGMILGIISGILSTGIVYFIYKATTGSLESAFSTNVVPFTDFGLQMLIGFLIMGAVVGVIASMFSMGKYLKREGSEFSAIS